MEGGVAAGAADEVAGRAVLDDPPVVDHDDAIRDLHRREPVGDDHGGAVGQQGLERALNEPLRRNVERRRRLVEDEHRGVREERTRERDKLALTRGEACALLVHVGRVAVGQPRDELVRADRARRSLGLRIGSARLAEADVVGDRTREEEVLLSDRHDRAAQVDLGEVAQTDAVERDAPLARVPEAGREASDGGLPRARLADEGDGLTGRDEQVEVVQNRALTVREPNTVETDLATRGDERPRVRRLGNARHLFEHS